jgi:hypothetical protein
VTRRLDLTRPVRCARCGQPFTRTHGRQKLCVSCQPRRVRARSAARAAARPARLEINRQARTNPGLVTDAELRWAEMLASPCPHDRKLGECPDPWCAERVADFKLHGGYLDGVPVKVKAVTRFGLLLDLARTRDDPRP